MKLKRGDKKSLREMLDMCKQWEGLHTGTNNHAPFLEDIKRYEELVKRLCQNSKRK